MRNILFLAIPFNLYAEPPETALPDDIELRVHLITQQALEQAMEIINKADACKCLKYGGQKLIACMAYASKEEVRKTFSKMSLQARTDYLMSMNLVEYKYFLDAFDCEEQWRETLSSLPPEEQHRLPQTVLEQLLIIRDTWISCSQRRVGIYTKEKKDPRAQDIAAWRDKTLENSEKMGKDCAHLWQWLEERFMEQKVTMFYALRKNNLQKKG